jgi:hypothetical protein
MRWSYVIWEESTVLFFGGGACYPQVMEDEDLGNVHCGWWISLQ